MVKDATDLLQKFGVEKPILQLLRGCQLEHYVLEGKYALRPDSSLK